jgi:hypothetical protein
MASIQGAFVAVYHITYLKEIAVRCVCAARHSLEIRVVRSALAIPVQVVAALRNVATCSRLD